MVFREKLEKIGVLEAAMARTSQDQVPVRAVLLLSQVWVDQDPNQWFSHDVLLSVVCVGCHTAASYML